MSQAELREYAWADEMQAVYAGYAEPDDRPSDDEVAAFYADMPTTPPPTEAELVDMAQRAGDDGIPF